ncbi:MAG: hypothetical protein J3Q66DRAFT_350364 [Benniella sp.]|nr:MAG: hypothetical protein J3Q66DRAFT_350364 [Benniella sp.]
METTMSIALDPAGDNQWGFLDVGMVIGPVTGYIHQYYTIFMMKSSLGFSSATCGVLLVANITRIFFWLGDPFELPLLYQSILMITVQLLLLEICVRYYPKSEPSLPMPVSHPTSGASRNKSTSNTTSNMTSLGTDDVLSRASRRGGGWFRDHATRWSIEFWNWPTIWPYFTFIAIYTSCLALAMYLIGKKTFFVECLGFLALGIEATVPMPQAFQNYRAKSTEGFAPSILLMWVIGDSVKLYYFISEEAKFQFVGCGAIQLCIDCVIIVQTVIYSKWWKRRQAAASSSSSLLSPTPYGSTHDLGRTSTDALLGEGSRPRSRGHRQSDYGTEVAQ